MKLYNKFKKIKSENFLEWLILNNYISSEDLGDIKNILDMYINGPKLELSQYKYFNIKYGSVNNSVMMSILEKDRFIF